MKDKKILKMHKNNLEVKGGWENKRPSQNHHLACGVWELGRKVGELR